MRVQDLYRNVWNVLVDDNLCPDEVAVLEDVDLDVLKGIQQHGLSAVVNHLLSIAAFRDGALLEAESRCHGALRHWGNVLDEIDVCIPKMAKRSHVFHARLASRNREYYRELARNTLRQLALCCRLKSAFIEAMIAAETGIYGEASTMGGQIIAAWNKTNNLHLRDLKRMQDAVTQWSSNSMARRSVLSPGDNRERVGEDFELPDWEGPWDCEEVLKFGYAAAIVPL